MQAKLFNVLTIKCLYLTVILSATPVILSASEGSYNIVSELYSVICIDVRTVTEPYLGIVTK